LNSCEAFPDLGRARQVTGHNDPANITVTQVDQFVEFYYNWECVTWIRSAAYYRWYVFSGWQWPSIWHPRPSFGSGYRYGEARVYARYANHTWADRYCPSGSSPTYTHYWPNLVRVFSDGWAAYDWVIEAWGGCAGLLWGWRYTLGGW
jgi:hypothetical protein